MFDHSFLGMDFRKCRRKARYFRYLLLAFVVIFLTLMILSYHLQSYVIPPVYSYSVFCDGDKAKDLTVSLSTIPPSLEVARAAVHRLTLFPCVRRVVLQLPREFDRFSWDEESLQHLKALEREIALYGDRVILNRDVEDYGPATKLLGLTPHHVADSSYVLYLDDDVIYSNLCDLEAPPDDLIFGSVGKSYTKDDIASTFSLPCINPPVDVIWGIGGVLMNASTWHRLYSLRNVFVRNYQLMSPVCRRLDDNTLGEFFKWAGIHMHAIRHWKLIQDESLSREKPESTSRNFHDKEFGCHLEFRDLLRKFS